jgi:hypothetical protein
MPSTISKFAKGFLSLLGVQNFGSNPRTLADHVQATVDIGEQYQVETQEALFGNNSAANGFRAFTGSNLTVPAGELWRVLAYAVSVVSGVGDTGRVGPSVRIGGNAGPRYPLGNPIDYVASQTNWVFFDAQPLWLPAGYELGAECAQTVGAATITGNVIFVRLRA